MGFERPRDGVDLPIEFSNRDVDFELVGEAHDGARPAPEFLEPVVGPLIRREDVHDHIAEVEQHPTVIATAFAMP